MDLASSAFSTANMVELAAAVMLALLTGWIRYRRPAVAANIAGRFRASTRHTRLYILAAALFPVAVRLAILPWLPPPEPTVPDEFGHLLVADTLASGRLANPPHVLWRHFETVYVLQQPTYASSYTIGQGLMLAVGKGLTGHPWGGVLLAVALMSGATSWMLFGCLPPVWAAAGGLLFAVQYGFIAPWVDSYWGGAFCAAGGALLFGALCRLQTRPSKSMAAVAGLGWTIVWLIRPFESILPLLVACGAIATFAARDAVRKEWLKPIAVFLMILASAGGLTALHNRAVTGSFTTIPYALSQKIYGVPQGFLFQKIVEEPPLRFAELKETYSWQRDKAKEQPAGRLGFALEYTWIYFVAAWYSLPIALSLLLLKDPRVALNVGMLAGALAASALYPFFFPHYIAAYVCVLSFLILRGLMMLSQWSFRGKVIGPVAVALLMSGAVMARLEFPAQAILRTKAPQPGFRTQISRDLARLGGQHVMFVRYTSGHSFHDEWVYNDANVDSSPLVWSRWMGPVEDAEVTRYYKGRRFWVADVGKDSALVSPYEPGSASTSAELHSAALKK